MEDPAAPVSAPSDRRRPGDHPCGEPPRVDLEVVVPVRWDGTVAPEVEAAFEASLAAVAAVCDLTVVDGSTSPGSELRRERWARHARILTPDPVWAGPNGKVTGAVTGVVASRHAFVVIADDDVRHDHATLSLLHEALQDAELVVPANYPTRWPWWAWWDGGRSLLNRAVAVDWPGTVAVRRDVVVATGGWSPHVLFENVEMARTVRAAGGRVRHRPDILVRRDPPVLGHFVRQRLRQAYEDQADPVRLLLGLAVVPAVLRLRHRPAVVAAGAATLTTLAEVGRRRAGGRRAFPWFVALAAAPWALERGVFSWLAVVARVRGGIMYHGTRMSVAAHRRPVVGHHGERRGSS